MLANHDQFTHEMCDRLKTTCISLGLVRLLQDAKRFDEARTTLYSLENGLKSDAEKSDKPGRNRCKPIRLKGTRTDAAEILPQPLSIA